MTNPMTATQASAVYDILVREAGADNRELYRHQFVSAMVNGRDEFNLSLVLPFPATFFNRVSWHLMGDIVLMSYQDAGTIYTANAALAGLKAHYDSLAEALN